MEKNPSAYESKEAIILYSNKTLHQTEPLSVIDRRRDGENQSYSDSDNLIQTYEASYDKNNRFKSHKEFSQRPRSNSMRIKHVEKHDSGDFQRQRQRRQSLPASALDKNLIANFLAVPGRDVIETTEMLSVGENGDSLRRVRSLRDKSERQGESLRRVRSFKTTSKGLVNRGDSFKRNKNASQSCSPNLPEKLEAVKIITPDNNEGQVTNHFRVMVLGAPGVGKTSVIDQFMTSEFLGFGNFNISQSEDDRAVTVQVDGDESTMEFIQSEDLEEDKLECLSIDGYILTYSITDRSSFDLAIELLKQLRDEFGPNRAIIVAANKSDLVRKRTISTDEGRKTADSYGCKYIEISAALNHKVDELLVGTFKQILLKERAVSVDDQTEEQDSPVKKRTSSFKKTKHFLEKLFRVNSGKEKKTENLYVE